jgi:hypothetical protein
MSLNTETLYRLLPAIYRIRDVEQGEPLKALMAVIARQAELLEADISLLYENWFIETCDEWVVPYIGDLLGVRGMHPISTEAHVSLRAFVANTLRYRRRKGTATVLEQLAFDITGWRARAVEFFELLETTQFYNHIRLHNVRTPDLRLSNELELLDTAFDNVAHTGDVRHINNNRGRHNIPNIGLFLWRLQSYPINRASARLADGASSGKYTFSPLGDDTNLFNKPQTETQITHLAQEINVPGLLRRRPLYDELEARRQALVDGKAPDYGYFDDRSDTKSDPVIEVFLNGSSTPVSPNEVLICNLENWQIPPDQKTYKRLKDDGTWEDVDQTITLAADPVLGRLTFPNTVAVTEAQVSYAYGFSGDIGGGPYDRRSSVEMALTRKVDWQVGVSKVVAAKPGEIFDSLTGAIQEWHLQPAGKFGVIALLDNYTYDESFPVIKVPEGSQLLIVAAKWPEVDKPGGLPGETHRVPGHLDANGLRPHLRGNLSVVGLAPGESLTPGKLLLDGVLVEGGISFADGNMGSLKMAHCTLAPSKGGLKVDDGNKQLKIDLVRSISGPISLDAEIAKLSAAESIIDHAGETTKAIEALGTPLELKMCTIFGAVHGLSIEASNCIFNDKLDVLRRQEGCVRFSYVPDNSNLPRCYRCQPELEIARQISDAGGVALLSKFKRDAIRMLVLSWLVPGFTSIRYGHYAYAQLSLSGPQAIRTGADDGSEMGVFNGLKQPQRESNLKAALDEYLRFGLEAGIIYVT